MATILFLSTIAVTWLVAMFYPIYRRHSTIVRESRRPLGQANISRQQTLDIVPVRASEVLVSAVREHRSELFRQSPLVAATWLAFIAVDFRVAIDHPLEAGLLVGMAAVLRRHMRKRFVRDFSERLRARLLVSA